MSLWRSLVSGLRSLANRSSADRDVHDEVDHYLEQLTAAHLARGLSPADARREARREFGSEASVVEGVRGFGWENAVESLFVDIRLGMRRLRSAPGFTVAAVLTLALGTGATTTIFSAIHPILIEPLPYPQPDRIQTIWDIGTDDARLEVTYGTWRELVSRSRSFAGISVLRPWQPTLRTGGEPDRLTGQRVSASYFGVLGVVPAIGRDFEEADDRVGATGVVVLSDALWRSRFGADPSIVGRTIDLDDVAHVVIGVMPEGFENVLSPDSRLWTPLQYDMSQGRAWGHHLRAVGRLRPGVSVEEARRELDAIAGTPVPEFARATWASLDDGLIVRSLHDDVTGAVRPALLAVLGAVFLVLSIACVNLTNLLLARGIQRRGEFALRSVLGAGRERLVRQSLTESLMLALVGGAAGLVVSLLGIRAMAALSPPDLPRLDAVRFDGAVFAFGLVITTLIGLASGSIPALRAARTDPHAALEQLSRRTTGGHHRTRSMLVALEVALALVLLVASGLLLRSLDRLFAVDTGFDPSNVLTMQVQASGRGFEDDVATKRFFARVGDAVAGVPGVEVAGLTSQLPLSGDLVLFGVRFEPAPPGDPGEVRGTYRYAVSPGYFEAMRIPVVRGRTLDARDGADAEPVALISERLVRRRLGGADPIGMRLRIGGNETLFTVVGVAADLEQTSLDISDEEAVYTTVEQWPAADRVMSITVRGRSDVAALAPAIRQAIWSVDPGQAVDRITTMHDLVAGSAAQRRFALVLFAAFALASLFLAAAGVYGVLAGTVAERTAEIGVRSALGASRSRIIRLVLGHAFTLTAVGVAIGVAGAALAGRALTVLLFGVSPFDLMTYAGVITMLLLVVVAASVLPTWRALRVDPARSLQSD